MRKNSSINFLLISRARVCNFGLSFYFCLKTKVRIGYMNVTSSTSQTELRRDCNSRNARCITGIYDVHKTFRVFDPLPSVRTSYKGWSKLLYRYNHAISVLPLGGDHCSMPQMKALNVPLSYGVW